MNATQILNSGNGPTPDNFPAPPPAKLPTNDAVLESDASYRIKWELNGRPQTILPHMPQEYVWH